MLKRKDGKEINPDTFIYSVSTFKLVKHNADMDEEYIYIRVAIYPFSYIQVTEWSVTCQYISVFQY